MLRIFSSSTTCCQARFLFRCRLHFVHSSITSIASSCFPFPRVSCLRLSNIRSMALLDESELAKFSAALSQASKVTVLTGAGISAESGIPTFRGEGGLWRTWSATELATPEAFAANPSLVWEFYHYRRVVVASSKPNFGHYAIAALQQRCDREGKVFTLLTQNIDELHQKAGSKKVIELHGSLWKTRCCTCRDVQENLDMPICPALEGKGAPSLEAADAGIPPAQLPRCKKCNGLLRPHVVWFGEALYRDVLEQAYDSLNNCDLLLVVGTSAVVQPAANFAPIVKGGGGLVAEFNLENTPISRACRFKFLGKSGETLVRALGLQQEELGKQAE